VCGAEGDASLAVHAVFVFATDDIVFGVVAVGFVGALVHANFAADTLLFVAFYYVIWEQVTFRYCLASSLAVTSMSFLPPTLPITGSPPLGVQSLSSIGDTKRIDASSDDR